MRRRDFITILGGAAATIPNSALLRAATLPKRPIIGVPIFYNSPKAGERFVVGYFMKGLQDRDYVVDRDLDIQFRLNDNDWDRWPAVVEEVIQLKPDVIYALATLEAVGARKATSTIPIVCSALANAVRLGLIENEATRRQRHRNSALYCWIACETSRTRARNSAGPDHSRAACKFQDPKGPPPVPELEAAGRAVGLDIVAVDVNRVEDIENGFRELANKRVDVVIVLATSLFVTYTPDVAAAALATKLPTVCEYREHVIDGALISYGVDLSWCFNRAGYFIDKILHGAAPGDLPIEFPTKFPLSINLRTAKELGITVPPSLLSRADEVIE